MANVLSLAMRINADASGFRLDPVQRALVNLGNEADKLTGVFDKFAGSSDGAARAQEEMARKTQELINTLRDGGPGAATKFAAEFEKLTEAAQKQAAAFEEGARVTASVRTEEERRNAELQRLDRLLQADAISQETYNRAVAEASGANRQAAEAARLRADAEQEATRQTASLQAEAQRIRQSNLTAQERFDEAVGRASTLRRQGFLTEQDFNRELEKQSQLFARNATAANQFGNALENAGDQSLKFNELSGIFSALPGPLGSIAGRISGIASASEGLSRVFAGGLRQGLSGVVSSLAGLANPLTIGLAGIAAFGAGATAVVNGLSNLDSRLEGLTNTANKLGVSFGFIQTLEQAAQRSGTSIEAVSAAFGRLQRSVLGVDEESKAAQKALSEIGVTAEELQALSPEQQYQRIGEALAAIEDPARRTAAATSLFGRAGADLIPFFNNIDKAANDMQRFGATISNVDNSRVESLGDAFDGVSVSILALGQSALLPFAGLVEGVATAFSGLINIATAVAQVLGTVLTPVLDGIGSAFKLFGDAVNGTVGFFRRLVGSAEQAAAATSVVSKTTAQSAEEIQSLSKAFESSNRALDTAIAKAGEFGQAGFKAALQFKETLADLEDQARNNELNTEQYARGVALATAEYEKQIAAVKEVADENKRLAEEAQRRAQAEAAAIQSIIDKSEEQLRIDSQFGGDTQRARAADNLIKLQEEQLRVEEQIRRARESGNLEAANALAARLATIDQVAAREQDIASGAKKQREEAARAAEEAAKEAERASKQRAEAESRIREQIAEKEQQLFERQAEIRADQLAELASPRTGSVQIGDIREGGISQFFATLQEDPAISEARKSRAELEKIRKEIAKLNADRVDILGAPA